MQSSSPLVSTHVSPRPLRAPSPHVITSPRNHVIPRTSASCSPSSYFTSPPLPGSRNRHENGTKRAWFGHGFSDRQSRNHRLRPHLRRQKKFVSPQHDGSAKRTHRCTASSPPCLCARVPSATLPNEPNPSSASSGLPHVP